MQGADGPGNSFVYIPSLKAVVTGDIVFDHVYFGVPRDAARENWLKTIDQIAALKPAVVIPGPRRPGRHPRHAAIDWMKKYIADWDANVARSKNAAEMRANVLQQYPLLGMEFTLNDRVATYFPRPLPRRCGAVASNSHRFGDDRWPGFRLSSARRRECSSNAPAPECPSPALTPCDLVLPGVDVDVLAHTCP